MTFRPSLYSFHQPTYGLVPLTNPKLSEKACDKANADRKKYLKKMWATPILTQKRVNYEKKANTAAKTAEKCKKVGVGGRSDSYPNMSIPKLWQSDPAKRKVEAGMIVDAVLAGPEVLNVVTAATKGWAPTVAIALEWRAEIAGGLLTLQALGEPGYEDVSPDTLQKLVALTLSKKDNTKLLKLAGEKGNDDKALKAAAKKMRAKIAKFGNDAMTYAFGMRGLLMVSAGAVAQALQSTVRTGALTAVAFIPLIGTAISGIGFGIYGAKAAIAQTLAKDTKLRMQALVDQSAAKMAAVAERKNAEAELKAQKELAAVKEKQAAALVVINKKSTAISPPGTPTSRIPALLWAGVAAVVLAGVVIVVRSRSST